MDSSFGNDMFMGGAECSSGDGLAAVIATYQQGLEEAINAAGSCRKRGGVYSSVFDEDLGGEEDSLSDEKQVEKKRRLSVEQVKALEKNFEMENKLEPERKVQLARELGLQPRQVAVWFQNRRARWKTKQLEKDFDLLRSEYDDLKSSYTNLVKDKDMLQSEVARLQERLAEFRPPCNTSSVKTYSAHVHQTSGRVKVKEEDSEKLPELNTCGEICKKEGSLSCESDGSEILEVDSATPAAAEFVYENCYHHQCQHQNNICNSMKLRLNSKEPEQDQGGAFTWPWDWA